MKFGELTLNAGRFGGYEIVNRSADSLPQELATAIAELNTDLIGATYLPLWYVGKQLVNGTNYFLLCRQIRATRERDVAIVGVVLNVSNEGRASIVEIIDECALPGGVQEAFDAEMHRLLGVRYKPIAYIGSQVVRGANHYILCEARPVGLNSTPYAAIICINIFNNISCVISIEPISSAENIEASIGE